MMLGKWQIRYDDAAFFFFAYSTVSSSKQTNERRGTEVPAAQAVAKVESGRVRERTDVPLGAAWRAPAAAPKTGHHARRHHVSDRSWSRNRRVAVQSISGYMRSS